MRSSGSGLKEALLLFKTHMRIVYQLQIQATLPILTALTYPAHHIPIPHLTFFLFFCVMGKG